MTETRETRPSKGALTRVRSRSSSALRRRLSARARRAPSWASRLACSLMEKRRWSTAMAWRSSAWRKLRILATDDFVVVGFTPPGGSREGFGSLDLGWFAGGELVYAGRVGTGFTDAELTELRDDLDEIVRRYDRAGEGRIRVWPSPAIPGIVSRRALQRVDDGSSPRPAVTSDG